MILAIAVAGNNRQYETLAGRLVDPGLDPRAGEYYVNENKTSAVKVLAISKSPNDNQNCRWVHVVEIYKNSEKMDRPVPKKIGVAAFKKRYPWLSAVYLPNRYDEF